MNILFTIDRGYVEHVVDCIKSIVRFEAEDGYDIYILHSDLREEDEKGLTEKFSGAARIHCIYVNSKWFSEFPETVRYPRLIYYRIFAAALLPDSLERILYLDGDTLVINSLDELYHMDFGTNDILACTHIRKILNKVNQYRLGTKEEFPYINSGVMLMNLASLRKNQKSDEIAEYIKKHKNTLMLPDQDVITAIYGSKIGILNTMKYNLSDRMLFFYNSNPSNRKCTMEWIRENTVVIHYYGKAKPWNNNYYGKLGIFYRELKV